MKRLLFVVLIFFTFITATAQQLVMGTVRDGFLKIPLPEARITLMTADSVVVQDSIKVMMNKQGGGVRGESYFMIKLPKKTCTYLLRATLDGYDEAWQTFSVKAEINDP